MVGLEAVHGIVAQYQFARSADAVTQKAQIALQRISVELGYVKATNLDVSGTTVTNGAAPAIGYTANLPAGDETHGRGRLGPGGQKGRHRCRRALVHVRGPQMHGRQGQLEPEPH